MKAFRFVSHLTGRDHKNNSPDKDVNNPRNFPVMLSERELAEMLSIDRPVIDRVVDEFEGKL